MTDSVSNCRKVEVISIEAGIFESCETCHNGYYRFVKHFVKSAINPFVMGSKKNYKIYDCAKQEGSIEKNFYVRPELSSSLLDGAKADMY